MTLHLLKQTAKPSRERGKRKKYDLLQFSDHREPEENKDDGGAPDKEMGDEQFRDVTSNLRKSKRNKAAAGDSLV